MTTAKRIINAFKHRNIELNAPVDLSTLKPMEAGVTNQFTQVEGKNGKKYLVRLNGKLWAPFTRDNENQNLYKLKRVRINTTVFMNDAKEFQICYLQNKENNFSAIPTYSTNLLTSIAYQIRRYHTHCYFTENYPLISTILSSLKRILATSHAEIAMLYLDTIIRMANSATDKGYVSSHNDLLPSSIYVENDHVSAIVDWEYSAANVIGFDIATLSLKASLTPKEEHMIVNAYNNNELSYSVSLVKPVVNYLFFLWSSSSSDRAHFTSSTYLMELLRINLKNSLMDNSGRKLMMERGLLFFDAMKNKEPSRQKINVQDHQFNICGYVSRQK